MATIKSIEEKAKAYDKALEKARQLCAYPTTKPFISDLQDLFPELKESEDERMVKFIKQQLFNIKKTITENYELDAKLTKAIDWLKAKFEQKPAELSSEQRKTLQTDDVPYESSPDAHLWTRAIGFDEEPMESKPCKQNTLSEEDEKMFECAIDMIEWYSVVDKSKSKRVSDWLKSLKDRVQPQKQEWSYNDEIIIETIIQEIEKIPSEEFIDNAKCRCLDWLRYRTKSLRPQSYWKPSYEQISVLEFVMEDIEKDSIRYAILNSVLEQLKKLKE